MKHKKRRSQVKRKNNIYLYMTVLLMIIYIGLLAVLCISEHMDSRATIRSFGDAFWYSLVTLTTVGYGDLLPVTPLGHAIGVVFLLMSAGIMMTLFGAVISFVTSEGFPLFLLGFQRNKNWYYFADYGAEANILAANIYKEDPDTLIIFGEKKMIRWNFRIIHVCLLTFLRPELCPVRRIPVPGVRFF